MHVDMPLQIQARFPLTTFNHDNYYWSAGLESFVDNNTQQYLNPVSLFDDRYFTHFSGYESFVPNEVYHFDNGVRHIFDNLVVNLVIDTKWCVRLKKYVYGFYSREPDHIEFFGSPYLGTHRIIYRTSDRSDWFNNIIDIDDAILKEEVIKCKHINPDFKVSSDAFNLSIVYLMHRVSKSSLPSSQKTEALINLVLMFHYRVMTSIMSHYFGYLANKKTAEATYNALTLKFDIKRYGSWNALFKARAKFIINRESGIHYDTFTRMDDDKKIVYMLNDMETRLKGVINDYYKVFYKIKENESVISSDNGFVLLDGKLVVRDIQKSINQKKGFLETLLGSGNTFYKEELVDFAIKGMERTPPDKFKQLIRDFPYRYNDKKGKLYREFVDNVVTHLFEYINEHNIKQTNVREVFLRLRGSYMSSNNTHPLVLNMRKAGEEIVLNMTGIKTPNTISAMRTSLMLYLVLRTITADYFS